MKLMSDGPALHFVASIGAVSLRSGLRILTPLLTSILGNGRD